MKLIEILPNVYGVKVLGETIFFNMTDNGITYYKGTKRHLINDINFKEFKILGLITAEEISFDVSEIVEKNQSSIKYFNFYKDYKDENNFFVTPEQSFRSALPKEVYFENPIGERNPMNQWIGEISYGSINWQTAQENITEKLLILQKL